MNPLRLTAPVLTALSLWAPAAGAGVPGGVAAPGEALVATFHAEGAHIYECKADTAGKLVWQFREPIATLVMDGRTVGRHFAGPTWQFDDGGAVTGRVVGRAAVALR